MQLKSLHCINITHLKITHYNQTAASMDAPDFLNEAIKRIWELSVLWKEHTTPFPFIPNKMLGVNRGPCARITIISPPHLVNMTITSTIFDSSTPPFGKWSRVGENKLVKNYWSKVKLWPWHEWKASFFDHRKNTNGQFGMKTHISEKIV